MDKLENILDIGGRQLSPGERQFVTTLLNELEQFQYQAPKDRALMFHPLGGFQRYLIHKVTQVFPRLTSFSIGDEKNRRTVVCFKSKKRDQLALQGLTAPRNEASPRNDYVNSPQRSVDQNGSRRSTPTTRSRESSRSRKKPDHADPPQNKASHRSKPEASSYLPKPLRSKKAATKRDQMKRSRSLQSSPLRGAEREPHPTVESHDVRRGRSRSQSGKQPRSASLKPSSTHSRRRERTESPNYSEDDRKMRKSHIAAPNVSDVSLKKRGQGLRMEGRVMNGDIEDPYSCGDSESDAARVDAEAVRRENERHKKNRYESSSSGTSEESEEYASEVEVPLYHNDEHYYENTVDYESGADTDERPPSYGSLKRSASLKKAQRNLKRIKQAESQHSSRRSSRNEESSGEGSSSEASLPMHNPKRSSSSSRTAKPHSKKSSTLPKSMKETPKRAAAESRKAHTLKSAPSSSRKKSNSTPPEKRRGRNEDERLKKPSTSSTKSHNKPRSSHRANVTETDGKKKIKSSKDSLDDFVGRSNPELYHPLPEKQPKEHKVETKASSERHNHLPPKSEKASSKELDSVQCEGGTQTEVTGTLSRPKAADQPQSDNSPESAQAKSVGDFLAAMMQSLGLQSHGNQPQPLGTQPTHHQPQFHPNMNAFHQHMQNMAPPPPPSSFPPLPPHMIHHIYMSWLGAYYAGVTGTLPPPPPFVLPSTSNPSSGSPMTSLDYLSPNFLSFLKNLEAESGKPHEGNKNEEHYYNDMYPSASHFDQPLISGSDARHHPAHSFEGVEVNHHSEGEQGHPSTKSSERHPREYSSSHSSRGRYGSSLVLTDTDASSVVSSSRRSEPGAGSTKPGVVVYVCSQPSSRKSSVGAPHDSIESDIVVASPVKEPEKQAAPSRSKKTRVKDVKKEKQRQSTKHRASTPHKIEGDHEAHPSDSSYDADMSRGDDAGQGSKPPQNDVSNSLREVADDVVVQDPQFDYYNWKPSDEEWKADEYKKFVEIYNFPPKLSDIEISRYLTKYRHLRLTRVDKTLALCTLPSEEVANELLREKFPIFSTRPLREASEKSRKRARNKLRDAGFEKVRAGRPKTDPSAAKRMIAASLGTRNGATSSGKRVNDSSKK